MYIERCKHRVYIDRISRNHSECPGHRFAIDCCPVLADMHILIKPFASLEHDYLTDIQEASWKTAVAMPRVTTNVIKLDIMFSVLYHTRSPIMPRQPPAVLTRGGIGCLQEASI